MRDEAMRTITVPVQLYKSVRTTLLVHLTLVLLVALRTIDLHVVVVDAYDRTRVHPRLDFMRVASAP